MTFDAEQLAIEQMQDGMIDAMVVQTRSAWGINPFATHLRNSPTIPLRSRRCSRISVRKVETVLDTGLKVVVFPTRTPSLHPEVFKEFGEGVEVLSLQKFQEWLKQYNLTSFIRNERTL